MVAKTSKSTKPVETKVVKQEEKAISNRSPDVIAAEIRSIDQQARQYVLHSAVEIGRRLHEAKELVPHGEWGKWLEENVSYKQSTANNFMRIAEEYKDSQTLASLSYSQAVALLSVPAEDREKFVEENNAHEMSTRELQAAIKAKQELEQQLEAEKAAREEADKARSQLYEHYQKEMDLRKEQGEQIAQLQQEIEAAKKAGDNKELAKLKTDLRKKEREASEQQAKLDELTERLNQMDAEIEKRVAERVQEAEKAIVEKSSKEKQELQMRMEDLEKQLSRSNNEAFLKAKIQLQEIVAKGDSLVKAITEVKEKEEQDKLKAAAVKVIEQLRSLF